MGITVTDLIIRKYAPEILTGYGNQDYATRKILPPITVKSKESKIATFSADHMRLIESVNSGLDPASEVNDGITYVNLDTVFRALGKTLTQAQLDEFPNAISAVKYAYGLITTALQIEEEYNLATAMTTSGNYTVGNRDTPGTKWNVSGGDPEADFDAARAVVKGNCTKDPNCLAVSWKTFLTLASFARGSLGGNANYRTATPNDVAAFFGFDEVIVLGADYNSAIEGQTTAFTAIWGTDNAFLFYKPRNPKAMEPAFGYTVFVGKSMKQAKKVLVDPQPATKFIASMDYQSKTLSYAAVYQFHTCL